MSTRIGCDNLHYAIMSTEDTATSEPTYATIKAAPGVMSVNINPNASVDTLFADDGPMDTASTLGKISVEIQKNELTSQNRADLLGHTIDANGGVVYSGADVPPWVAVGFRTLKSNGKYRYVWLYKGKFTEPEDNNETKGDSINFQSDTITGNFVKLIHPITINSKSVYPWKLEIDEDHTDANSKAIAKFFTEVFMPSNTAET